MYRFLSGRFSWLHLGGSFFQLRWLHLQYSSKHMAIEKGLLLVACEHGLWAFLTESDWLQAVHIIKHECITFHWHAAVIHDICTFHWWLFCQNCQCTLWNKTILLIFLQNVEQCHTSCVGYLGLWNHSLEVLWFCLIVDRLCTHAWREDQVRGVVNYESERSKS